MNESRSCCWLMCCDALKTIESFVASDKSNGFVIFEKMDVLAPSEQSFKNYLELEYGMQL